MMWEFSKMLWKKRKHSAHAAVALENFADDLPSDFNEEDYLNANSDIRQAVEIGTLASGADHYRAFGRSEARPLRKTYVDDLPPDFNEVDYLDANSDIRRAVKIGTLASGADHYRAFGRGEGRPLRKNYIHTLHDLDQEIARLRILETTSYGDWLLGRNGIDYYENTAALPADPLSPEYRQSQLDLYHKLAGVETYNPWAAEPVPINVAVSADPYPFPFSSRHEDLIGGHLAAMANIFRVLWRYGPKSARTVLEYGCGTGFTTIFLATAGYEVTAVDINAEALQVVDAIAENRGLRVRTFPGEFGSIPNDGERFEVILFYEAFHHCLDFPALLARLHDLLLPGGILVLAGEPIFDDFPKPWGLRLDGASLWEIRTKGWLELGFNEGFLRDLLAQTGWTCERLTFQDSADIFVARAKHT